MSNTQTAAVSMNQSTNLSSPELDELCVNTLRFLAVDMVQKANSGHPGLHLGSAAMAYALWDHVLKFNPRDPLWPDRDRFVLSAGHGSAGAGEPDPIREEMTCEESSSDDGRLVYRATVSATRPVSDYTVRLIPDRSGVAVPLEFARILWQR